MKFHISSLCNEQFIIAKIHKNFYIVEKFSTKILIKMNVIKLKKMNISTIKFIIKNCHEFIVDFFLTFKNSKMKKIIMNKNIIIIIFYSNIFILTKIREWFKLLENRDFMFHFESNFNLKSKKKNYNLYNKFRYF